MLLYNSYDSLGVATFLNLKFSIEIVTRKLLFNLKNSNTVSRTTFKVFVEIFEVEHFT